MVPTTPIMLVAVVAGALLGAVIAWLAARGEKQLLAVRAAEREAALESLR